MKFVKNHTCPTPEMGIYNNMIVVPMPEHMKSENGGFYNTKKTLAIDPCILEEILFLWDKGVHTGSCCCGHNLIEANVLVESESRDLMLALGYEQMEDKLYGRDTLFKLKSGCLPIT